nr:terpene synthase family protein [Kibdelosporangium phytohabitans]
MCAFYTMWDDRIAAVTNPDELRTLGIRCLHLDRIAADPHTVPATDDPFEHAYRDLWLRTLTWASPQQAERIQRDMLHNSLGWLVEGAHDLQRAVASLADYREIRWATSTLPFFVDLNEIVRGFEVPLATALDPAVRQLVRLSMTLFTTTNDIFSCARDAYRGHFMNLPAVLAHAYDCSLQQGMDMAAQELRAQTSQFLALAGRLRQRAEEKLPELVDSLQDMVAGHLVWIRECGRYVIDALPV